MGDISLKIKSDFVQAERDFQTLQSTSESARLKMIKIILTFFKKILSGKK